MGSQRELEQAELIEPCVFAVRRVLGPPLQLASTRADDELTRTARIGHLIGALRREALVMMRVPAQDQLGPYGIQLIPEPSRLLRVAVRSRAPARTMKDGEYRLEMTRLEIVAQP